MPTDCPSRDKLQVWLDKDDVDVSHHVDTCADCQGAVETLLHDCDTFLNSFRDVAILAADSDPSQRLAIDSIKAELAQRLVEDQQATEEPDEWIGRTLGNYRIEALLGNGGMGRVYRAQHVPMQRTVAIKLLLASRASQQQAADRFVREWVASAKVSDPNVVLASDAGEINGVPYLVLEHLDGINLRQLHKVTGHLSVSVACELVRQTASGLVSIQQAGLVHRDIKPSNLMLTSDGVVKILDLGLARLNEDAIQDDSNLTASGVVLGTMQFMAPEQCSNPRDADVRADLYSLGCTLYFLLTGNPPFYGPKYESAYNVMQGHVADKVPSVAKFRDDIPDGLLTILNRLLAKSPEERFASPAELVEAITPFAADADLGRLVKKFTSATGVRFGNTTAPLGRTRTFDSPKLAAALPTSVPSSLIQLVSRPKGRRLLVASFVLISTIVFGMTPLGKQTIRVVTNRGEVVIQDAAPNVKVAIRQNDIVVKEGIGQRFDLQVGAYDITLKAPGGTEIHSESFHIIRGGRTIVRVQHVPVAKAEIDEVTDRNGIISTITVRVPDLQPLPADELGDSFGPTALVTSPTKLQGVRRWTIETIRPRGTITQAVLDPKGNLVATAGSDGTVRVYQSATFDLQAILPGLTVIESVSWSPDSRYIAAGDAAGRVVIWELATQQLVREWRFSGDQGQPVVSLAWSPDGASLLAAVPGPGVVTLDLRDEATEPVNLSKAPGSVVAWNHDGSRIVLGSATSNGLVKDTTSGRVTTLLEDWPRGITAFTWSPDNQLLAAVTMASGVRVWNDQGELLHSFAGKSCVWIKDSKRLIVPGVGMLLIWNASTGELENELAAGGVSPTSTLSLVGNTLAYSQQYECSFGVIDLEQLDSQDAPMGHFAFDAQLGWSRSDRGAIATAHTVGQVVVFDPATVPPIRIVKTALKGLGENPHLAWSPDGQSICLASGSTVGIVDLQNDRFDTFKGARKSSLRVALEWSEAGLAIVDAKGDVVIWDASAGKELHRTSVQPFNTGALAWDPTGKKLAFGTHGTLHVWKAPFSEAASPVSQVDGAKADVAWSPDGRWLAFGRYDVLYLQDAVDGGLRELKRDDRTAHDDWLWSIQWLPESEQLVTHGDSYVRVWEVATGELVREIEVSATSWLSYPMDRSPDGKSIAVCGTDRVVRLWGLKDGKPLLSYMTLANDQWLVVAPDGNWMGSEGVESEVCYLVETEAGVERLTPEAMRERYQWQPDAKSVQGLLKKAFDASPAAE